MIQDAIRRVVERENLTADDAKAAMQEIIGGAATQSQIGSFVTAMRMKGETESELRGFVQAMRSASAKIGSPHGAVDMCGTGGDGANTFNISTTASFVVAAAGVPVAKHGNRSVSSKCGSADVLSALRLPYDLPPAMVDDCLRSCGLGFMFAPVFHRSMMNVVAPRREIGIRTFFNILGPMTNPAGVKNQLIGVYDSSLAPTIGRVLRDLGTDRAMIVNGSGMDELTNTGRTRVVSLAHGELSEYEVEPGMFGMDLAEQEELKGGDSVENARIMLRVLKGERSPRSDVVAMNAGAGIFLSGKVQSLEDGVKLASEVIHSGKALKKAEQYDKVSSQLDAIRQRDSDPSALSFSRINRDVLKNRSKEIVQSLLPKVRGTKLGEALFKNLDPSVTSDPNTLSVILLRRILSVVSDESSKGQDRVNGMKSSSRLSEAIASSKGIAVIAEYKPRSPSTPSLIVPPEPAIAIDAYSRAGVAGVSVLVEPEFFSGSPGLFESIRRSTRLPMLYKDFVVGESQLDAASGLGADAVLLIAKALGEEPLDRLVRASVERGIEPLVEIHDEGDIDKLRRSSQYDRLLMVGINSRDLRSLKVDLDRVEALRTRLGSSKLVVAESGLSRGSDFARIKNCNAALIGSAFMQADDLESKVKEMVLAGRSVSR